MGSSSSQAASYTQRTHAILDLEWIKWSWVSTMAQHLKLLKKLQSCSFSIYGRLWVGVFWSRSRKQWRKILLSSWCRKNTESIRQLPWLLEQKSWRPLIGSLSSKSLQVHKCNMKKNTLQNNIHICCSSN